MIDAGTMAVAVQRQGRPETRQILRVAMHYDLSHLLAEGWEFPRVVLRESAFGSAWVESDISAGTAA